MLTPEQKRVLAIGDYVPKSTASLGYGRYNAMVSLIDEEETMTLGENVSQPNSLEVSRRKADPTTYPGLAPAQFGGRSSHSE